MNKKVMLMKYFLYWNTHAKW